MVVFFMKATPRECMENVAVEIENAQPTNEKLKTKAR